MVCGVSVDSRFSHAAFGEEVGGIEIPLLADFHPKGAVGQAYGVYSDEAGLDARSTVIIDPAGQVVHAEMADGQRDMEAFAARCEALAAGFSGSTAGFEEAPGLSAGHELFVKDRCMFSRWARYARTNLHLQEPLVMTNVSTDEAAAQRLEQQGGKRRAPALWTGSEMIYESGEIVRRLVDQAAPRF